MEHPVSARRFTLVSKPHIYKLKTGYTGRSTWCYNPAPNTDTQRDRRNTAAYAFCDRLTEASRHE